MHRPAIALTLGVLGGLAAVHPAVIGALCFAALVLVDFAIEAAHDHDDRKHGYR